MGFMNNTESERSCETRPLNTLVIPPTKVEPPTCHFKPMKFKTGEEPFSGTVEYWECDYCGHTEDFQRIHEAV